MMQTRLDDAAAFGDAGHMAVPRLSDIAAEGSAWVTVTDDAVFQSLCLLLLFCIALLLRHGHAVSMLAGGLGRSLSEDYESSRKLTALSSGFFSTAALTGLATITVVAVKYSSLWLPSGMELDSAWVVPVAAVGTVLTVAAVALWETVTVITVGVVAGNRDFADTLLYVKRAFFSLAALVLSPVVLLSALSDGMGRGWLYVLAAECVVLLILFLRETLVLFIRKKVPIFQWFLYLCAVEAFPLTLICASIARLR